MNKFYNVIFAPGFFESSQVLKALLIGTIIALVSSIFGVFVIVRKQAFVGHAISDFGGAGAAVAFLLNINTVIGFLFLGVISAIGAEMLGKKVKERDIATGVVLSLALGFESLFLFLDTHYTGHAGAPMMILFGSVFIVRTSTVYLIILISAISIIGLCIIFRPLLLVSVAPDLAKTQGGYPKLIGIIFVILLAFVVDESSVVIGTLLSIALLVGPAATAMHLTHRIGLALISASCFSVISMWLGILLAYDSYQWFPSHQSWPVSFFVCTLILIFYILTRIIGKLKHQ